MAEERASWKLAMRVLVAMLLAVMPLRENVAASNERWLPLVDRSLEVVEGSALDFSGLVRDVPAGSKGWIGTDAEGHLRFAGDARPQRFLCASLVPSEPNGGLPGRNETDRWVAQLVRTGYNLVRLHFIDAILMTGRSKDFDYDPVALDRLYYLMARLKSAGIYWIVDGVTSENGAYGDIHPHRWVEQRHLKGRLFHDPEALAHWKRLIETTWGRTNPYTGIAPISDPAMLGVILVNEQSLAHYIEKLGGRMPASLAQQFDAWRSGGAARSARAHSMSAGGLLKELWANDPVARDFAAFSAAKEAALFRELDEHVRGLGFKGLTTTYNYRPHYLADIARGAANWVDMHAYQSLPTHFALPGSMLPQTSIFDDVGRYGRQLANARQWGKPFTVTEYGQPFWNAWRHESAGWVPALAAHQGWDAICQFAELPVLLAYADRGAPRRRAIHPYGIGADPITRAGERLAALLFLRGDVAPARVRVALALDAERMVADGRTWDRVPESLSRLALVAATGIEASGARAGAGLDATRFSLAARSAGWMGKATDAAFRNGLARVDDPVAKLKQARRLPAENRTDLAAGFFESDTDEIRFDSRAQRLSIATDRAVVFTQRSGAAHARNVALRALSGPATVAVASLEMRPIATSGRLLVWALTDALNTDMRFADPERSTLEAIGRFPPRIRIVTGELAIAHARAGALKVWALDQAGKRVAAIPAQSLDGVLRFAIDNDIPGYGPVTYFEVAEN